MTLVIDRESEMPMELCSTARRHPHRAIAAGLSDPSHAEELASQQS